MRTWIVTGLACLCLSPSTKGNAPVAPIKVLGTPALRTWCLVSDLAFADESELVSADCRAEVKRWDVASGKLVSSFKPGGEVLTMLNALSRDGSMLAVVQSKDPMKALPKYIVVWKDGKKVRRFDDHPAGANGLAFSPDASLVATADSDEAVRIWDAGTGKIAAVLRNRSAWGGFLGLSELPPKFWEERDVSFSPDGRLVASVHMEGEILVRDVQSGDVLHRIEGEGRLPVPVFFPGGRRLAHATHRDVRLYSLEKKKDKTILEMPTPDVFEQILVVAVSPDGNRVAAGTSDAKVYVWDLWGDGTPLTITDHADRVEALEFSPGGTLLATGGRDRTLGVWDARTGASALPLVQHFGWLEDMDFSPDGSLLVTAGEDARVHVHDVASGKLLRVLHAEQAFKRVWMDHSVAFSPDGLLYSGSTGGDLLAWDPSTGEEKLRVDSPSVSSEIDISPDGSTIAMIDAWGSIVTVDAKTGKTLAKLDPPKGSWGYHFVRWTDGGKRLVSTGMDSGLRYWEPKSGKLLEDVQLDHTVYQLLVPPEPGILYIRSYDELVTYVHAKGGTWKKKGKRRCEGEAALSPDGTLLALAGKSTIEIRDRGTGAAIQKIVPGESVLGLAFGPDGTVLATSHDDGTVDLWRIGGQ